MWVAMAHTMGVRHDKHAARDRVVDAYDVIFLRRRSP